MTTSILVFIRSTTRDACARLGTWASVGILSVAAVAAAAMVTTPCARADQTHAAASPPTAAMPLAGNNAPTPPMGYNNWAQFMCNIDARTMRAQADALVAKGLAAAGYDTVTVDDCWMRKYRDADGNLQARTDTFPSGMKALGAYIHAKDLKYGIYIDAGTVTCSGSHYMGSYGHIDQDIAQLAKWGADYVKVDGCNMPEVAGETKEQTYRRVYTEVSRAIAKTGRPMVFSNSAPAYFSIPKKTPAWYTVMDWSGEISELWRESWDIPVFDPEHPSKSRWPGIMRNYDYNKTLQRFSSVGHRNDPDFIIGGSGGVSDIEGRTQLTLWSMMAAPLILSTDVTALHGRYLADLENSRMIAIDQDRAGVQGWLVSSNGTGEVMYRPLANGDFAISLFNRSDATATLSTTARKLGFKSGGTYAVTNVWSGARSTSDGTFSTTLPAHAAAFFRVTPKNVAFAAASGQVMPPDQTLCLDASAALAKPGAAVTLASCDGSRAQRMVRTTPRTLEIADTGMCLEPVDPHTPGAAVTVADCGAADVVAWTYRKTGQLVDGATGQCLGTRTKTVSAGVSMAMQACGDNPLYQIWSLPGVKTAGHFDWTWGVPTLQDV